MSAGQLRFRELSAADAEQVAAIEAVLFHDESPWSREVFVAQFAQPYTFYVGAFAPSGEVVGYAGLAVLGPRDDPEFELHTIGVAPLWQGRGVGRLLMDQLLHTVDLMGGPMFLEVRTDNEPALGMYRSYGFEVVGLRKQYYQPSGADAFSMMRQRQNQKQCER